MGEIGPEEFARDGKDQAGLNLRIEWTEKIGKCQTGYGVRKRRHRNLHSVARKINPFQKVSDLVSTNAKSNLKHFRVLHFLTHGSVETGATLLNVSEVKGRCIRDRLNMVVTVKDGAGRTEKIGIRSGDGGNSIQFDRLRKCGSKVRIGCAAVANVPACVDVELHEVCQAQLT